MRERLKAEIIKKYGSVNAWAEEHGIFAGRFYQFLSGKYNPTVKTLESWLSTVDLELSVKKKT